jgi:hypothetical protein
MINAAESGVPGALVSAWSQRTLLTALREVIISDYR